MLTVAKIFPELWKGVGNEWWHMMVQLAEALPCKPEGHGFQSRWCHWKFFTDITLPATLWPWLQLSLKQK